MAKNKETKPLSAIEEEKYSVFQVRLFTDIEPNERLVATNMFTKNSKIYKKQFFHAPWMKSRFIVLKEKNADIDPKTFELGADGTEVKIDAAFNYRIKDINYNEQDSGYKPSKSIGERWKRFLTRHPILAVGGTAAMTALLIPIFLGSAPYLALIPYLAAAGYISVHEDENAQKSEWAHKQGPYKYLYNSDDAKVTIDQMIYDALKTYCITKSSDDFGREKITLDSLGLTTPGPNGLSKLQEIEERFGIEIVGFNIKNADYSAETNALKQKEKEAKNKKFTMEQEALGQAAKNKTQMDYLEGLTKKGLNSQQVTEIMMAQSGASLNIISGMQGAGTTPVMNLDGSMGYAVTPGKSTPSPKPQGKSKAEALRLKVADGVEVVKYMWPVIENNTKLDDERKKAIILEELENQGFSKMESKMIYLQFKIEYQKEEENKPKTK